MSLASETKRQLIREACHSDRWMISGRAARWLGLVGIRHDVAVKALIRHIDDECLIHVKVLHVPVSYHGSLFLDPRDSETVYFEVKILDDRIHLSRVWLQVHPHDLGYPILPRE